MKKFHKMILAKLLEQNKQLEQNLKNRSKLQKINNFKEMEWLKKTSKNSLLQNDSNNFIKKQEESKVGMEILELQMIIASCDVLKNPNKESIKILKKVSIYDNPYLVKWIANNLQKKLFYLRMLFNLENTRLAILKYLENYEIE